VLALASGFFAYLGTRLSTGVVPSKLVERATRELGEQVVEAHPRAFVVERHGVRVEVHDKGDDRVQITARHPSLTLSFLPSVRRPDADEARAEAIGPGRLHVAADETRLVLYPQEDLFGSVLAGMEVLAEMAGADASAERAYLDLPGAHRHASGSQLRFEARGVTALFVRRRGGWEIRMNRDGLPEFALDWASPAAGRAGRGLGLSPAVLEPLGRVGAARLTVGGGVVVLRWTSLPTAGQVGAGWESLRALAAPVPSEGVFR